MPMRCLRCGVCCRKTEMLLSIDDIERLKRKGYSREFFVRFGWEGYPTLRNWQGHCVFYDSENGQCKAYKDRPLGCRLYPLIFDELKGIIVNNVCHAKHKITEKEIERKGEKVVKLLEKIVEENQI